MTEIHKYAPVLIPTLNRYDHFKRCLESLESCTGADKTDVYVGLDYPPSEKYVDGWKKIDAYLAEKEKNHGFKNLFVRRRDHNCGVGNPNSNGNLLLNEILHEYDTYIFTEDDNEFSLNFLDYMNKSLWRFKDDDRIIKVCGYNFVMQFPEMYRNNFYFSKSECAWGMGSWVHKNETLNRYRNLEYLKNLIRDDNTYHNMLKRDPRCVGLIMGMLKAKQLHGDAILEVYAVLEDKYFILPTISKTRNYGNDGTGWHSPKMNEKQHIFYSKQEIDQAKTFDFTDDIFTYEPVYLIRQNFKPRKSIKSLYKKLVMKLDVFLLRRFDILLETKYL